MALQDIGQPADSGGLLMAGMIALPLAKAAVTLFLPARPSAIANLVVGPPLGRSTAHFLLLTVNDRPGRR